MKVRALPTCRKPVGDGANRTRSIAFEYSGIGVGALGSGQSRERRMVTTGYQGNSSEEDRHSGPHLNRKIVLRSPCPRGCPSEDTYCLDLPGMTGLSHQELRPGPITTGEETLVHA